ncbi:MAG TPA: HIT family protein [Thermoanaerobaculia bacterium]|nr:HIT family protein [Thermoanaerobaculia bacterium]
MTCVFCTDPRQAGEIVFDDGRVLVVLHEDWAVRGHAMVVWHRHVENVADLTLDDYVHFAAVHHRAEVALLAATKADRAVLMKLGIATPHLHLHIYPVAASLTRDDVFEILDGRVRAPYDEAFVAEIKERLDSGP